MKEYTVTYTVDFTNTFKDIGDIPDIKKHFERCATVEMALGDLDDFKIRNLKVFERELNDEKQDFKEDK